MVWQFHRVKCKFLQIELFFLHRVHLRIFCCIFYLKWQAKTLCLGEDFSPQAVIPDAVLSFVVTWVCVINSVDGPLSQIYYSVHFKWSHILLVQSNVSQKGNWNRQTEVAHVRRLEGNSTTQSIKSEPPSCLEHFLPLRLSRMHGGPVKALVEGLKHLTNTHTHTHTHKNITQFLSWTCTLQSYINRFAICLDNRNTAFCGLQIIGWKCKQYIARGLWRFKRWTESLNSETSHD